MGTIPRDQPYNTTIYSISTTINVLTKNASTLVAAGTLV